MSIFAGFLRDRWNKKITMLVCDTLAIFSTGAILFYNSNMSDFRRNHEQI